MRAKHFVGGVAALATLSMIATAMPGTAGPVAAPTVREAASALLEQGSFKVPTVAGDSGKLVIPKDASDKLVLNTGTGTGTAIRIGLPDGANHADAVDRDGVAVYRSTAQSSATVVNPTAGGVQIATVLASAEAPSEYAYPVSGPAGSSLVLGEDGGASMVSRDGSTLMGVQAPWARDAEGRAVPTRFVVTGSNVLTQVVDHASGDFAYPITADPDIFTCDAFTSFCVKFTKSETKSLASKSTGGAVTTFVGAFCGKIPNIFGSAVCAALVVGYAAALGKSFRSASANGKCIEVHFLKAPPALTRWKTEGC